MILASTAGVLVSLWVLLLAGWWHALRERWGEPVLNRPVLILESDDWGAGPAEQIPVLEALQNILLAHRDATGRPAVMTLGVVLAAAEGFDAARGSTRLCTLADPVNASVLTALKQGEAAGVLVPQLHGFAHFEPEVLNESALRDPAVAEWCRKSRPRWTEELPSQLQSSLVDGASLPSRDLPSGKVAESIATQGALWRELFGSPPLVAVPTTFIWNEVAEVAWAAAGVRWLVTPGHRSTARADDGRPSGTDRLCLAGQRSPSGLMYLVRDVYFEPVMGHGVAGILDALATKVAQGRACLIETHRFNYAGPRAMPQSLAGLRELLGEVLRRHPSLCFLSTAELGLALAVRDPAFVTGRTGPRLRAWLARIAALPRFGKLATLTGLLPVMRGLARVVP